MLTVSWTDILNFSFCEEIYHGNYPYTTNESAISEICEVT